MVLDAGKIMTLSQSLPVSNFLKLKDEKPVTTEQKIVYSNKTVKQVKENTSLSNISADKNIPLVHCN